MAPSDLEDEVGAVRAASRSDPRRLTPRLVRRTEGEPPSLLQLVHDRRQSRQPGLAPIVHDRVGEVPGRGPRVHPECYDRATTAAPAFSRG